MKLFIVTVRDAVLAAETNLERAALVALAVRAAFGGREAAVRVEAGAEEVACTVDNLQARGARVGLGLVVLGWRCGARSWS